MTRKSIKEYAAALRRRYLKASKAQKRAILNEFCETADYHRKSAIRLLRHPSKRSGKRRGRRREYGSDVARALRVAWEATDRVCSKRLAPFLPELVPVLERQGELKVSAEVRSQLLRVSPATIDRLLARARQEDVRRPRTSLRSSTALKAAIPIRTFGDWAGVTVGFMELGPGCPLRAERQRLFPLHSGGGRDRHRLDRLCTCVGQEPEPGRFGGRLASSPIALSVAWYSYRQRR